jgi:DNA-binding NarL/FixJ family response regulator
MVLREKTHVLIVDDQALFADSLKSVIAFRATDFQVVGVAKDGQTAIDMARSERPDIILMDIRMPGLDGVRATRTIHEELPEIKILVLTSFDDDDYIFDAMKGGAMGYILKDIPVNELIASLRAMREGSFLASPVVAKKLVERARNEAAPPHAPKPESPPEEGRDEAPPEWLASLGKREREILALIAEGHDNARLAEELFISEQTVKNYVYGLYVKIGEHNRLKVMRIAERWSRFLRAAP